MSNSLRSHGMHHASLPCVSLSFGVCSNSSSLSWWWYLTISYSANLFPFCLQSFPASGSFPTSQLFTSGGLSIGASASASALPMNIQGLISFRIDWFVLLAIQGTLNSLLQHHNSKAPRVLYGSTLTFIQVLFIRANAYLPIILNL